MFGKTLLQTEIASEVCFNYTVLTLEEPIKISQRIFKYLLEEYDRQRKISSPEELAHLQACDAILEMHLKFIEYVNGMSVLNKDLGITPSLFPGLELLEYIDSYSNVRLVLKILNGYLRKPLEKNETF